MEANKIDQLRVRLTKLERRAIDDIIRKRNKGETVSDLVREALYGYIDPKTHRQPVFISETSRQKLAHLAVELKREEGHVMEDCLDGILDIVEGRESLVVQEIQLRRRHAQS